VNELDETEHGDLECDSRDAPGVDQAEISVAQYARVEPGEYTGHIVKTYGPYRDRQFRRWKLRVEFALETGELVSAFYGLGNGKSPSAIKPRFKLYRLLILACGYGRVNVNPEALINPSVLYRLRVGWSESGAYSVVTSVLGLA
jgi:hypothetical protein